MTSFFDYVESQGLKPTKLPLLDHNMYYGILNNYDITLLINPFGLPELCISTSFPTKEDKAALTNYLSTIDMRATYHITNYQVNDHHLFFMWNFYPDTMNCNTIADFIAWLLPLLEKYHASHANICTECGCIMDDNNSRWYSISGTGITRHLHKKCCGKMKRLSQQGHAFFFKKYPTYKRGILGAFIGSMPAILLWAIAYQYGDIVVPTGLAVSFLVWIGYTFNCGFRGKLKPLILYGMILCSILIGFIIHPLFGTPLPSPYATDPFVLLFMSHFMACFLFISIWIMESIYYSDQKKSGLGGIVKLK